MVRGSVLIRVLTSFGLRGSPSAVVEVGWPKRISVYHIGWMRTAAGDVAGAVKTLPTLRAGCAALVGITHVTPVDSGGFVCLFRTSVRMLSAWGFTQAAAPSVRMLSGWGARPPTDRMPPDRTRHPANPKAIDYIVLYPPQISVSGVCAVVCCVLFYAAWRLVNEPL